MAPLVTETRESLSARRAAILRDLGMSAEEFRRLADNRTLTGEEWEAREELEEIDFLLGGEG